LNLARVTASNETSLLEDVQSNHFVHASNVS
jgi:hypothetical protein